MSIPILQMRVFLKKRVQAFSFFGEKTDYFWKTCEIIRILKYLFKIRRKFLTYKNIDTHATYLLLCLWRFSTLICPELKTKVGIVLLIRNHFSQNFGPISA